MKKKISIKMLELSITWILALSLLVGILVLVKLSIFAYDLRQVLNPTFSFIDATNIIIKYPTDLRDILSLITIYRVFVIISIVLVFFLIVYRIITKSIINLIQFNSLVSTLTVMYSSYIVYVTRDLFFIIKSLINGDYTISTSNSIELMNKIIKLTEIRGIVGITFVILVILTLIALVSNIYEIIIKSDIVWYPGFNSAFFVLVFLGLIGISAKTLSISKNYGVVNVERYFLLGFEKQEDNIVPLALLDKKRVEKRYMDPFIRDFFKNSFSYSFKNKELIGDDEILKIKANYNKDYAKSIGLKILKDDINIKIRGKVYLLEDFLNLDIQSLRKYASKHDIRYIKTNLSDEYTGIYYSSKNKFDGLVSIQKIKASKIALEYGKEYDFNDEVYSIIYLGNIYINDKSKVIYYSDINNTKNVIFTSKNEDIRKYIEVNNLEKISEVIK